MLRSYKGVSPTIPASCYVDPSAQVIGDVVLGEQASIWMNAVVRGDVNSIRIGAKSNVQDCAVLHGMRNLYPVIVGEMVTIGHNATVHGCVLEDAVLVGIGAVILNNAKIGEGSIIAAGAVIPEQTVIPPNSLVAGVPGKIRRTLGDEDRKMILKYAQNYLDYTAIYLNEK
ncbi:MAG TPA: gamma carbonic anhydrase family protein [Edaphobacter sp.]|nr:gamma carbonic anhydrase family protein [Edaphobacter sp.]